MARSMMLTFSVLVFLFFISNCVADGVPGGITKIKDVKTNIEVQELGCYSVGEYNKLQKGGVGVLKFSKVVDAESQVVSGIKYYLKIEAVKQWGCSEVYDAEVVVKPWLNSKELLSFKPSK